MTQRLLALAVEHWKDLDGYAVSHGMPTLTELPFDRFCNYVWWWSVKGADEKQREKFESRLYMPPKGVAVEQGPWSVDAETSAFSSLRQSRGK